MTKPSTANPTSAPRTRSASHPMHRKAARLYSRAQLAALLGCSPSTLDRLKRSFLTKRQLAYLSAVGYVAAFYPLRKGKG